jgi:ferric-dicitrate binding protein FerR (iron transport regulator)
MSDTSNGFGSSYDPGAQIRPLSVRMTEDTRAQLDIIAQLNDRSVTEEVRAALEDWIERSKSDPKVLERAAAVKAEIEREAATKRGAIAAIFDPKPTVKDKAGAASPSPTSDSTKAKPTTT